MNVHPAALILADHTANARTCPATSPLDCDCGWTGPARDHPTHLVEVLDEAGFLTDGQVAS